MSSSLHLDRVFMLHALSRTAVSAVNRAARGTLRLVAISLAAAIMAAGLSGCGTTLYLLKSAHGQLDLLTRGEPIDELLESDRAPPALKHVLAHVDSIKAFGERHGLAIAESYDEYAELDRDAAVWVVTACRPLAFEPRTWSFPIVGSFPYLGFFDRKDAEWLAAELAEEGWDVYVRSAGAYSTLGWFRDPILSTMLTRGPSVVGDLANTVLHESVHATIYVEGQAIFNESLAQFVADRMTPRYLRESLGHESLALRAYLAAQARRDGEAVRKLRAYTRLETVYGSDRPDAGKLALKGEILRALERDLEQEPINNATLQGFRTYHAGHERFEQLLDECGGDFGAFLQALSSVDEGDFTQEQQEDLAPVLEGVACTAP